MVESHGAPAKVVNSSLGRLNLDVRFLVLGLGALEVKIVFFLQPVQLVVLRRHVAHQPFPLRRQQASLIFEDARLEAETLVVFLGFAGFELLNLLLKRDTLAEVLAGRACGGHLGLEGFQIIVSSLNRLAKLRLFLLEPTNLVLKTLLPLKLLGRSGYLVSQLKPLHLELRSEILESLSLDSELVESGLGDTSLLRTGGLLLVDFVRTASGHA
ncbi:uncharacterized protein QC761_0001430 [Podospora bellae-mahoneyi]|uniref:Uncharacterized protein n=1 Tax=Podospora bellae-mahoneyi TaxID=2093777 RepID=A0ABR0FXB6_9PEZI|nr:hypothetical protein QC761_0001430 [Podospora bellae-mahoneyi]